ncbi:MAG: HAD family hydrolase [Thermoanaerobaculia bacterium]
MAGPARPPRGQGSGVRGELSGLHPPAAILFDMGGVLLSMAGTQGLPQSQADFRGRRALLGMLRDRGGRLGLDDLERLLFRPWQAEYERRYERGHEASWDPHFQRLRRATGARGRTLDFLRTWFEPYAEGLQAAAGAGEALEHLRRRGVRVGLVSNVPLPGVLYQRILKRAGLWRYLEDARFSYDEGSRKPSPAMLRSAMSALDVPPRRTWMVGDRRASDVTAGLAAGVYTVWLQSAHRQGPRPDATIQSLAELTALVR